jgi:uncharacterized protein (TIGR03437 family)
MKRISITLGVSLCLATAAFAQTPSIFNGGVVNAASYAIAGLPNSGIAQGGMFIVFGTNMGPATLQRANTFPLSTNLGGTSISVTVGGTTTQAIILYTSAGQVAGVMRSNTPTGSGTMRLTYNGSTSAAISVQVVQASFGAFTLNEAGSGAAVILDGDNQPINSLRPARPGQTVALWGTGLGPVTGDETQAPAAGNLATSVEVLVGTTTAVVVYKGRAPCCVSIDQINFVVPQGLSGCAIPVVVKINNVVSNSATLAVSSSGPCSDSNGLTSENFQRLQSQGNLRIGSYFLTKTTSTSSFSIPGVPPTTVYEGASGVFSRIDQQYLLQSQATFNQVTIGGCVVSYFNGQAATPPSFAVSTPLDAGTALSVTGPNGQRPVPKFAQSTVPHIYSAELSSTFSGTPSYMGPGSYTLSGPGGPDVGPFSVSFNIASPLNWTNQGSITNVNRSQNLLITWTGGPTGSNAIVIISGYSAVLNSDNTAFGAVFYCQAPAGPGQFTVPSAVLLALPVSSVIGAPGFSTTLGNLYVGAYFYTPFTATGLDQGYAGYTETFAKTVAFQ